MRTAVSRRSGRRCASLVTPLLGFELTVCAVLIHALRSGAPRDKLSSVGTAAPHRRLSLEGVPQSAFPGTAANGPCWGLRRFWGSSRSRHRAAGLRPTAANTRRRARTSYWTRSLGSITSRECVTRTRTQSPGRADALKVRRLRADRDWDNDGAPVPACFSLRGALTTEALRRTAPHGAFAVSGVCSGATPLASNATKGE